MELNMPKFDSPIGGKRFTGQQLKEVDVPDESESDYDEPSYPQINTSQALKGMKPLDEAGLRDFQARLSREQDEVDEAQVERDIRQAKSDKRAGRERLSDGARKRIEMLIGMTRGTRTTDIEGNSYTLQTLKAKEMRAAIAEAAEFDGTVHSPFEIRRQLIARSLVQVAGVDVEQFIGSTKFEARLDLVDDMDDSLLNRIYDEYLEMIRESRARYAIKTEADGAEVVEDLKK